MSENMKWAIFLATAAFMVFFLIACGVGFSAWAGSKDCAETANAMRLEHQYGFWNGCMIQLEDGQWVKLDSIRVQR